ncbi:hypothetical protein D6C99_08303 [Aureobasidium pullulans]|nr:hypothetical protein D6C99_08303 [Aureobasidium pullulans]
MLHYHRQENDRAWISLQPATSFASPTLHTVTFASISPNTVAVNNESGSANMLTGATYASNGEECPSGFETPRCDECGGAEQTVGQPWYEFHCKGSSDDESDDGDDLNDSTECDDSEHTAADIQNGNNPWSTQNQQTDSDDQSPIERSRHDRGGLSYGEETTSNGTEHSTFMNQEAAINQQGIERAIAEVGLDEIHESRDCVANEHPNLPRMT